RRWTAFGRLIFVRNDMLLIMLFSQLLCTFLLCCTRDATGQRKEDYGTKNRGHCGNPANQAYRIISEDGDLEGGIKVCQVESKEKGNAQGRAKERSKTRAGVGTFEPRDGFEGNFGRCFPR